MFPVGEIMKTKKRESIIFMAYYITIKLLGFLGQAIMENKKEDWERE